MNDTPTLNDIIGEFDAGIFEAKSLEALKMVALGVIANGKKGNVTIKLDLEQIGETGYVEIKHKLSYSKPTRNGKVSEENETSTPMYVDSMGNLSVYPADQEDMFRADKLNQPVINKAGH